MEGEQLGHWLAARAGKLTGSRMGDAIATLKGGGWAKERANLMRDLLAERLTGLSTRHYVSPAMMWGTQTEPEAIAAYETATGAIVRPCGFYDHPRIDLFGATPDGLIDDGVLEVKCPTTGTFIDWITAGVVPEQHQPQMLAEMACTGRSWCEFVAYDPRVKHEKRRLFIRRFEPPQSEIERIEAAAEVFLSELDAAWEALTTAAA